MSLAIVRWIAASPSSASARWALADQTHWTADWREARRQYIRVRATPAYATRARERLELLRHDHPNEIRTDGVWWRDNTAEAEGEVVFMTQA